MPKYLLNVLSLFYNLIITISNPTPASSGGYDHDERTAGKCYTISIK